MSKFMFGLSAREIVRASVIGAVFCVHTALPATADSQTSGLAGDEQVLEVQAIVDAGGSQRINLSGKLRMLSQRVVAAACYVHSGASVESSSEVLQSATQEFSRITAALEFGDEQLGVIGVEERRRTLAGINKMNELWAPIAAYTPVNATTDDLSAMAMQSADVLRIAKKLVSQISGQYTNPSAMRQADSLIIDLAGRQRMLAQRISKNACLISNGINVEAATAELQAARDVFGSSLFALRNGMPEMGILPPTTEELEVSLTQVITRWEAVQPLLDNVVNSGTLSDDDLAVMFSTGNALTGEMNAIVGLYAAAASFDS